jgi:hypothetical protein
MTVADPTAPGGERKLDIYEIEALGLQYRMIAQSVFFLCSLYLTNHLRAKKIQVI